MALVAAGAAIGSIPRTAVTNGAAVAVAIARDTDGAGGAPMAARTDAGTSASTSWWGRGCGSLRTVATSATPPVASDGGDVFGSGSSITGGIVQGSWAAMRRGITTSGDAPAAADGLLPAMPRSRAVIDAR